MDRRAAVSRIGLVLGGAISAPTLSALLSGCSTPPSENWTPQYFSSEQVRLLERIGDVIIPETDTPGASQSGVGRFIDTVMTEYYSAGDAQHFRSMLDAWDMRSDLLSMTDAELKDAVTRADAAAFSDRNAGEDEHFRLIKELMVSGYYTSEVGMTEELRLKPMGKAQMDVARTDVERSWSD